MLLGIDTSCDETSVAVLEGEKTLRANVISSQIKLHQPYGGVVPELASRSHLTNIPVVVEEALQKAGIGLKDLTGIAVTAAPGLIGCLLVGLSYAKALAYQLKIPLTTVHHLKGHLFSGFIENEEAFPFLGLVVSGGHTSLYYVKSFDEIELIGHTVDDAAGEAYDKVAKLLGLGFPGGPIIDKLAKQGNPDAFKFTRARVKKSPYLYSFSGLKTAVAKIINDAKRDKVIPSEGPYIEGGNPDTVCTFIKDLCASFQKEVVGALLEKTEMVLNERPAKVFAICGGVAANSLLRAESKKLAERYNIPCAIPSMLMCTDNGGMIAYVGAKQLAKGQVASLDANAYATTSLF